MSANMPRYGSDVIVDLLAGQGIRYVALNPGASFRGLHDSLVNRPGAPEMLLVPHEKLAVQLAHGYAKASGEMMAALLHDTVGLLHGTLGVFEAFLDRAPVLVLGGAGPMDTARRRPWIDWIHTSSLQGNAVRDFTKWDDQPSSVEAFGEAFARARAIALMEPAGPVYVALDADLQERALDGPVPAIDWSRAGRGRPMGPDPSGLEEAASLLVGARRPVVVAGYVGRDPRAFSWVPELAELVGAAIVDTGDRLSVPSRHSLRLPAPDALADADLVLLLDLKDISRTLLTTHPPAREVRSRLPDGCRVVDIGFSELQVTPWVHDAGPALPIDLRVTADTSVALPLLIDLVRDRVAAEGNGPGAERQDRRTEIVRRSAERRAQWLATAAKRADEQPVSLSRLAAEVWPVIREHDWVLTAGTADEWALRLWDFDRPYRHPGRSLGTATQIGMSLGVALAHRDSGRLVVDLQPDGDLLFDGAAPWIATAQGIPLLAVMVNNRAYWNDWEHQIRMAKVRGGDPARAHIGVAIDSPPPDFATLARAFGWHAEGPVEDPAAIGPAVSRAAKVVAEERRPALVDVVTAHR